MTACWEYATILREEGLIEFYMFWDSGTCTRKEVNGYDIVFMASGLALAGRGRRGRGYGDGVYCAQQRWQEKHAKCYEFLLKKKAGGGGGFAGINPPAVLQHWRRRGLHTL